MLEREWCSPTTRTDRQEGWGRPCPTAGPLGFAIEAGSVLFSKDVPVPVGVGGGVEALEASQRVRQKSGRWLPVCMPGRARSLVFRHMVPEAEEEESGLRLGSGITDIDACAVERFANPQNHSGKATSVYTCGSHEK